MDYLRCTAFLKKMSSQISVSDNNILNFIKIKQHIEKVKNNTNGISDRIKEMISDVYNYENYLKKVATYCNARKAQIEAGTAMAFRNKLEALDYQDKTLDLKVIINPFVFLVESHWKWSVNWIAELSKNKIAELQVIYNLSLDPDYYITALFPEPFNKNISEINIDRLSAEILIYFENSRTIKEFLVSFNLCIDIQNEKLTNENSEKYVDRIKELIRLNLLNIDLDQA